MLPLREGCKGIDKILKNNFIRQRRCFLPRQQKLWQV